MQRIRKSPGKDERAWLRRLSQEASTARQAWRQSLDEADASELRQAFAAALAAPVDDDQIAEHLAQCVVCVKAALGLVAAELPDTASSWLRASVPPPLLPAWDMAVEQRTSAARAPSSSPDPLLGFYEAFLAEHNPDKRQRRGVFYTPLEIARFIIAEVHRRLQDEFGLPDGLADVASGTTVDDGPFVRILDPALGSGIFFTEAIHAIHRQVADKMPAADWDQYVVNHLLPRICGLEILPAALLVGLVRIAVTLAHTGFGFMMPGKIDVRWQNALAVPSDRPATVVIGNPPFASLSNSEHPFIVKLLKGQANDGQPAANYFTVQDRPLGERKHWLHDDYVKFLRLAHHEIERSGWGIVGLVTNHGFLDNATFRGLREKLLHTFPRISVIDLHGNSKNRERTPLGERDENVFRIGQGVAISLLRRPPGPVERHIERIDLWGTQAAKLQALQQAASGKQLSGLALVPQPPDYRLQAEPASAHIRRASKKLWRLHEALPVNTTAPVTARDGFVVAWTREELAARLETFLDPAVSDDELRRRYFSTTRSARYLPGDTRSWRLAQARERLRQLDWGSLIRPLQYRPLDWRWIAWTGVLVDWPRQERMQHLLAGDNLALVGRRQSPTGNFFWAARDLVLDGIIRSDTRGSESLFPLWLIDADGNRTPNIAPAFLADLQTAAGRDCPPDDVAAWLYGLFFSPAYRRDYATLLSTDFPPLPLPESTDAFENLCRLGQRLLRLHVGLDVTTGSRWQLNGAPNVAADYPRFDNGRVYVNPDAYCEPVSPAAWRLTIGAHQVARKWLKDRRGRVLTMAEMEHYGRVIAVLEETARILEENVN